VRLKENIKHMEITLNKYVNSDRFKAGMNIKSNMGLVLEPLARGEYNINYTFDHPDSGDKFVFRVNTASQMKLKNQIEYEYKALKALERTQRTPKAYYLDDAKDMLPFGVLVMQYLQGRALDYNVDMAKAASIFADIHKCSIENAEFLVKPSNPLGAMLDECKTMAEVYINSSTADKEVKNIISRLIHIIESKLSKAEGRDKKLCIINTEVNSGNFIINDDMEKCCLIDWEKSILGEAAQDLAHFLAPTTTFWKTDIILTNEQQSEFLKKYAEKTGEADRFNELLDKVQLYLPFNCLRGITWCSMAWVQYSSKDKLIKNDDTFKKIKDYLSLDYLGMMENRYFI